MLTGGYNLNGYQKTGCENVNWNKLAEDIIQWQSFMMNNWVPKQRIS